MEYCSDQAQLSDSQSLPSLKEIQQNIAQLRRQSKLQNQNQKQQQKQQQQILGINEEVELQQQEIQNMKNLNKDKTFNEKQINIYDSQRRHVRNPFVNNFQQLYEQGINRNKNRIDSISGEDEEDLLNQNLSNEKIQNQEIANKKRNNQQNLEQLQETVKKQHKNNQIVKSKKPDNDNIYDNLINNSVNFEIVLCDDSSDVSEEKNMNKHIQKIRKSVKKQLDKQKNRSQNTSDISAEDLQYYEQQAAEIPEMVQNKNVLSKQKLKKIKNRQVNSRDRSIGRESEQLIFQQDNKNQQIDKLKKQGIQNFLQNVEKYKKQGDFLNQNLQKQVQQEQQYEESKENRQYNQLMVKKIKEEQQNLEKFRLKVENIFKQKVNYGIKLEAQQDEGLIYVLNIFNYDQDLAIENISFLPYIYRDIIMKFGDYNR